MRRRPVLLLATAVALLLGGLSPVGTATAQPGAGGAKPDPHLLVHRTADGRTDFLGSTDGRVLEPGNPGASPSAAARAHVKSVAAELGIGAPGRDLASQQVLSLKSGASLARFDQQIGGMPVFGGQVVVNMSAAKGLTSVLSHVSAAQSVARATLPQVVAEKSALAETAKVQAVDGSTLRVASASLVVFDPTLVDTRVVGPARPAWQVEVDGGPALSELVLVDARTGAIILRFNQVDSVLSRQVCDDKLVKQATDVPCTSPVRTEGQAASGQAGVDTAYTLLGETSQAYQDIAGIDLTSMIGVGGELRATVNWCFTGTNGCPFENAFWSGTEMYFGQGYEVADDVVAHELTHGVTDHTSNLFYFAQSGAMNESFSDVFGEIVDRRNQQPGEAPDAWLIGEDLPHDQTRPNGAIRNMADPTYFGDPDKMTSKLYVTNGDSDGVHSNSGVGNKTFYLISQGGTFNGVTMTGIDGSDPTLAKSALLYYDTLVSLTSGSEYADLGLMLQQQCGDLATAGTLGFTTDDCIQVADAVAATELAKSPRGKAAQPADPSIGCPLGTEEQVLFDGESSTSDFVTGSWWTRAPNLPYGVPANERSAGGSWAGVDYFLNGKSSLRDNAGVKLPAGQVSYLRFAQWHLFAYYRKWHPHGGTVEIQRKTSSGYKNVDIRSNEWVNGPNYTIEAAGGPGFGGDSHGWYTSRLSLTPQAGMTVRPQFTTYGEAIGNYSPYIAWYLDDIQIYTCRPIVPPGRVTGFSGAIGDSTGRADVTLTWAAPVDLGEGLTGYQVGGAGGKKTLPSDQTTFTFPGLNTSKSYRLWVRPLGLNQALGPRTRFAVDPVDTSLSLDYPQVKPSQLPGISGRLLTGGISARSFEVQFRYAGSKRWRPLHWPAGGPAIVWSTDSRGRFWATYDRPERAIEIRVHFEVGPHGFAGYSPVVTQRLG